MGINLISLSECRRLLDAGRSLNILDVRTPVEFTRVHASGARLMPLDELNPSALYSNPAEPLYVICHSGSRAAKACQRLQDAGLTNIFSIEGGTAVWEKAGLPVTRGTSKVIALDRQVRLAAGLLVLIGTTLGWFVHPAFFGLAAFVGAGLTFSGLTDFCGMALILAKMPWNRLKRT